MQAPQQAKLFTNASRTLNLYPSLFSSKAPSLSFLKNHHKNELFVLEDNHIGEKQPYFKMTASNYVSIRLSFLEHGWKRIDDREFQLWNVLWGRHIDAEHFSRLHAFQKVNHFPGSANLGRKDLLHANLYNSQLRFGREQYGFFPDSYILPYDLDKFQRVKHLNQKFISKPFASSCGRGISLVESSSDSPLPTKPCLLQRYMDNPYLINGKKFDLRLYVLVSSMDPLRIYLFEDGLVRFATIDYDKDAPDILAHLTNYSLNKNSPEFIQNNTEPVTEDCDSFDLNSHKWSFKALLNYLEQHCSETNAERTQAEQNWTKQKFLHKITSLITKTILSTEPILFSKTKELMPENRNNCFELYGFDVMVDEELEPYLVEVNLMPSLASSSLLDKRIKMSVLSQMFHTLGPVLFSRDPDTYDNQVRRIFSYGSNEKRVIMESEDELERSLQTDWRRIYPRDLSHEKNSLYWTTPDNTSDPVHNIFTDLFVHKRRNNQILEEFEQEKERNGLDSARTGL
jgi:hypothetical protein